MTDEEKEMKEWIEQRRKGSDLMSKLLLRNEQLKNENEELKKQIDQLSNDNYVLKTSFITQQEQNEKLQYCGNCRHCYMWEDFYINMNCELPNTDIDLSNKCDKWEPKNE